MAKYSDEFKLRVVKAYLEGSVGYSLIAKRFNMPSPSPILRWVRAYKEFGEEGIRKKTTKEVYSVHFKLNVLEFMKKSGASFQDTAIEFNMNNPNLIVDWHGKFSKKGVEGLTKKAKGRSPMSKKRKAKSSKPENELSREELLERENELLRLEIAYLKKLKAFQENPNAFLAKHKQQWHSNSKKKDSN